MYLKWFQGGHFFPDSIFWHFPAFSRKMLLKSSTFWYKNARKIYDNITQYYIDIDRIYFRNVLVLPGLKMSRNIPLWLEKTLKFTSLKWLKMSRNSHHCWSLKWLIMSRDSGYKWAEISHYGWRKYLKFISLKLLKMNRNSPLWLEKILKFISFIWLKMSRNEPWKESNRLTYSIDAKRYLARWKKGTFPAQVEENVYKFQLFQHFWKKRVFFQIGQKLSSICSYFTLILTAVTIKSKMRKHIHFLLYV